MNEYRRSFSPEYVSISLSDVSHCFGSRSIWIWGTGQGGRNALPLLKAQGISITGFIDSDLSRDGSQFLDLPVTSPASLFRSGSRQVYVFVASIFHSDIASRLKGFGFEHIRDYFILPDTFGREIPIPGSTVALFNDTGTIPHIGCMAVSDAHIRMLAGRGVAIGFRSFRGEEATLWDGDRRSSLEKVLRSFLRSRIEEADAVIVNGEGSIHHGFGAHLLSILEAGQRLGKKTLLVNAVLQEVDSFDDVLAQLTDLTVRDVRSSEFLSNRRIGHRIVVDSMLEAQFDSAPLFDLTGRVVVTDWHPARDLDVGSILRSTLSNSKIDAFFLPLAHGIHRRVWRQIPATLASAELMITARHHGIYLAALAGVPFVALPGNTHKIEGLLALSGFPIPLCTAADQLESALHFARSNRSLFTEFSQWLLSQKPLATFQHLTGAQYNSNSALIETQLSRFQAEVCARNQEDLLVGNWNLWPPCGSPFTRY
jgi:hypothetical protein